MNDNNLISLADVLNDSSLTTPEMTLREALQDIGVRGSFKNGKKLLILSLDTGEKDDMYSISFRQAGMSMSDCITLCEIAKSTFLTEMNYIPG